MAKKVSKKKVAKKTKKKTTTKKTVQPAQELHTFPPRLKGPDGLPLSESGISVVGFCVPIYDHQAFVYEDKAKE